MKSVTTKLVMSFAVISMAILAFSTVTLAWFTLSNIAKVNDFELSIIQDDGLEIRIIQDRLGYDSGWKVNALTKLDGNLIPLTTVNGKDFNNFDFTSASYKNYISFKALFRSKSNCSIRLSKMISESSDCYFAPGVDVLIKENNTFVTYGPSSDNKIIRSISVADACRASFIVNDSSFIYIFNKDKGQGCYNGFQFESSWVNPAIEYYNKTYKTNIKNPFVYVDNSLNPIDELDFINSTESDLYLYHKESISSKMKVLNLNEDLLSLEWNNETTYYEGNAYVNIWLEGWDADCFDAINNTHLKMTIAFIKNNIY